MEIWSGRKQPETGLLRCVAFRGCCFRACRKCGFGWFLAPFLIVRLSRCGLGGFDALRDQLDDNQLGRITYTTPRFNHPRVAAVSVSKPTSHLTEQLRYHCLASEKPESPTSSGQVALLAKRDHPIGKASHFLRFGLGSLNPLILQERGDQAPKQRPSVFRIPP